jgi:hypothetical protein
MVSMWLEGHEQDGERLQRALALTSIRRSCHDLRLSGGLAAPCYVRPHYAFRIPASSDGLNETMPIEFGERGWLSRCSNHPIK